MESFFHFPPARLAMTPGRRSLQFNSIDEIIPEVERLRRGHTTVGAWSLAHICGHLASVIQATLEAPAPPPGTPVPSTWFSPEKRDEILASGRLPEGLPLPDALVSFQAQGEQEEVDRLRAALAAFEASPGPVAPHRFLGPLTKDQWRLLHRIHCAHHLSFAVPVEP
jgi:Protein of unknown function (DUF1569)